MTDSTRPEAFYHDLRALRLWHFQEERKAHGLQQRTPSGEWSDKYRSLAEFHARAVRTLDKFFPAHGDTAERDEVYSV